MSESLKRNPAMKSEPVPAAWEPREFTEAEVVLFSGCLSNCPLCLSRVQSGYPNCFHCDDCGYMQCIDYDGLYDGRRSVAKYGRKRSSSEAAR